MRIIFLSILPHFIFDIPALSTGLIVNHSMKVVDNFCF